MKTYFKIFLTSFFVFFSGIIYSQTPEQMMKLAFPDLFNQNKITDSTIFEVSKKEFYRSLYQKLEQSYSDIESYKIGKLTEDNSKIFAYTKIENISKSENDLKVLQELIIENQRKISKLFYGFEKYGADSVKCVDYLSKFNVLINQNNISEAYNFWTVLFNEFPMASKNIYIKATDIIIPKIESAEKLGDTLTKELWIDTLLLTFDRRLQFFGDSGKYGKGYVLGRKGTFLLKYRTNTDFEEAYNILMESIKLQNFDSDISVILTAMKATYAVAVYKKIDCSTVVDNYLLFKDILEYQNKFANSVNDTKTITNISTINQNVDQYFVKTKCATCDKLEEVFTPKFTQNETDIELLKQIFEIFTIQKCENNNLYEKVVEALYKLEPSEIGAYSIAKIKVKKEKFEEASNYYDEAIKYCTIDTIKAQYFYEAAAVYNERNMLSQSKEYCYKAVDLKSDFGLPYILLATVYSKIAGSCSSDLFEQQTINWVIVDKLIKAKTLDKSLEEKVNSLISSYSSHFPDKNEGFFRGINEGTTYTVNCWIGEITTVRYN